MSKEELLQWAETVLKPAAELAAKGEGEYKAGDHCRFCKIKATCRKRAEYNLELARYDFAVRPRCRMKKSKPSWRGPMNW